MGKRIGKYKVSNREFDLHLLDDENSSPSTLNVAGASTLTGTISAQGWISSSNSASFGHGFVRFGGATQAFKTVSGSSTNMVTGELFLTSSGVLSSSALNLGGGTNGGDEALANDDFYILCVAK